MKNDIPQYAIGVDYGTNSVRALIVNTLDGAEIATARYNYKRGEEGVLLDANDPNLARQCPSDYILGFIESVSKAVNAAKGQLDFDPQRVVGIGIDTTGSTPLPVNRDGLALGMLDEFKEDLAAQAWLWKDHTAHAEAAEITDAAIRGGHPYLTKCGGTYSSEWYWAKILRCMRTAPHVARSTYSWVELADFVPAYITGNTDPETMSRCVCAAGHKAMYHEVWAGLPSTEFLDGLEAGLSRFRYTQKAVPSNQQAGRLSSKVAEHVGLPEGIPVAVGALDAHMGAVGAGVKTGTLVKIIGTSTCDCLVSPLDQPLPDIPGMCGIVPESILPNMYGLEAGQSAVGDIFNWFVNNFSPYKDVESDKAHAMLTEVATLLNPGESGLLALDWNNGNRTILTDPLLTGLLLGQSLYTTPAEIYRALIEATAFGALTIIQRVEEFGVMVDRVICCGGIADKNPLVMQIYADVLNRPINISRSAQACALGSAILGAVVGGAHDSVELAQLAMTGFKQELYKPVPANVNVYQRLFTLYKQLHDSFGVKETTLSLFSVMKELIAIREEARYSESRST